MTTQSVLSARDDPQSASRDLPDPVSLRDDEMESDFGYHSGYREPIGIADQIDILRGHWPGLNPDKAIRYYRTVYPGLSIPRRQAEGPFAIIRPGFFSDRYEEELEAVFGAIAHDTGGRFANYRAHQLGPGYLHRNERALEQFCALVEQQTGSDVIIAPAQFGLRFRGRSAFRARRRFTNGEFGPGAREVGMMLLTNMTRLRNDNDLWIDCPGDDVAPSPGLKLNRVPRFRYIVNRIILSAHWVDVPEAHSGSASFFLAQ